jgi:translation initiation factor eIF-2B subunit epsilon
VGDRTQIDDSYIFDHVTIGSNTKIKNSIIGSHVTIKSDCVIEEGCLLGNGVVIGDGTELRGVNVSLSGPKGSCRLEGPGSIGVVWPRIDDASSETGSANDNASEDSDDEEGNVDMRNLKFARLGSFTYRAIFIKFSVADNICI